MSPEWRKNLVSHGNHDLWDRFCSWAYQNGIGPEEGDWREWWKCFRAGAEAEREDLLKIYRPRR